MIEQSTQRVTAQRSEGALGPYLRAIRAHGIIVPLITLAAVLAAVAFVATRSPTYQATTEMLVSPVSADDGTFFGVQILRDTPGDPTRAVQTAATLADSPLAARIAAQRLGSPWTVDSVDSAVTVQPQGQSNILAVTAKAGDAKEAAHVANEFATATLQVRANALKAQVKTLLSDLETRQKLLKGGDATTRAELAGRINALQSLQDGVDPTLSVLQEARTPTAPVGASSLMIIGLALIAGFILATGAALLIEMLDRRIRDQEELLHLYPLPILARIPPLPRSLRGKPMSPTTMPPAVREGFRTLLVQLEQHPTSPHTIMVTSATTGDGKTSSAISLAYALVGAGHRVILIDFDLRKPNVGAALGVQASSQGLVSLLASDTTLADLLVSAPQLPPLKVVPAGTDGDVVLLEALTRRLPDVLREAEELADFVILDTPPLGEVSDALRMADHVDGTIIVARPGNTDRGNFEVMHDLLEQSHQTPLGFVLVGVSQGASTYYTYGLSQRSNGASRLTTRSPS